MDTGCVDAGGNALVRSVGTLHVLMAGVIH